MKRILFAALFAILFFPSLALAASPIKVLLIDGQAAGPYHNWKLTTPVIKKELEETGMFAVTVMEAPVVAPDGTGDFSNFHPKFSDYGAIVSNLDSPDWPADLKTSFEQYISNGGGFVVVHAADNSFPDWKAFNEMAGIGGWRKRTENAGPYWYIQDGKVVSDPTPGAAGLHGLRLPFKVVSQQPEHPIMKGLPKEWMHAADELYGRMRGPGGSNMTILATAHSNPDNKGTGHEEPMVMVLKFGKGRIFHTTMGHDAYALSCVGLTTILQRGTEWAATGKVTQKVPATFPSANTVSYRTDIAQMDPAYWEGPGILPSQMKQMQQMQQRQAPPAGK